LMYLSDLLDISPHHPHDPQDGHEYVPHTPQDSPLRLPHHEPNHDPHYHLHPHLRHIPHPRVHDDQACHDPHAEGQDTPVLSKTDHPGALYSGHQVYPCTTLATHYTCPCHSWVGYA